MTAKEAYGILMQVRNFHKIVKCIEYDSVFVFQVIRGENADHINPDELMDCLIGVNKTTRTVKAFLPFDIPTDEYKRGKVVTDFK